MLNVIPIQLVPPITLGTGLVKAWQTPTTLSGVAIGGVVVRKAVFTNRDNNPHFFSLYWVEAGGQPNINHVILYNKSVAGQQTYSAGELSSMVLWPGQSLWWGADNGSFITGSIAGFSF